MNNSKKTILIFLSFLLFSGIAYVILKPTDDFHNTKQFITTDKEEYYPNDTIIFTLHIIPEEEKTIRFYDNFRNIRIWTMMRVKCIESPDGLCEDVITQNNIIGNDTTISEYKISPERPFVKTFIGYLKLDENHYILSIPEMGSYSVFSIDTYENAEDYGLTGILVPINPGIWTSEVGSSIDDYISFKEIKIRKQPPTTKNGKGGAQE